MVGAEMVMGKFEQGSHMCGTRGIPFLDIVCDIPMTTQSSSQGKTETAK